MREVELGKSIWETRQKEKKLRQEADLAKAELLKLEQEMIDLLVEEGKSSTGHIDGVGEFGLKKETYGSVNSANMPKFFSYLREIEQDGIIKEKIEPATLKSYLKSAMEQKGQELEENQAELDRVCASLGISKELPISDIVAKYFEQVGVSIFQQVKISHTGRGK